MKTGRCASFRQSVAHQAIIASLQAFMRNRIYLDSRCVSTTVVVTAPTNKFNGREPLKEPLRTTGFERRGRGHECPRSYFWRSYRTVNVPSASEMSLIAASKAARFALSGSSCNSAERAKTVM